MKTFKYDHMYENNMSKTGSKKLGNTLLKISRCRFSSQIEIKVVNVSDIGQIYVHLFEIA